MKLFHFYELHNKDYVLAIFKEFPLCSYYDEDKEPSPNPSPARFTNIKVFLDPDEQDDATRRLIADRVLGVLPGLVLDSLMPFVLNKKTGEKNYMRDRMVFSIPS